MVSRNQTTKGETTDRVGLPGGLTVLSEARSWSVTSQFLTGATYNRADLSWLSFCRCELTPAREA